MAQFDIKPACIALCNATSAVLAAFGNRIHPDTLPEIVTYPCARILQIGTDQRYHLQGESGRKIMAQIDVYDDDLAGADANAEIMRNAFSGYKGQMGNVNAGMVKARIVSGSWNAEARNYHRIIEVLVSTSN